MGKISVETLKAESRGLRGSLVDELDNGDAYLTDAAKQLIKFHGSYQQEDRDARKTERGIKHYQFMIRSKLPGGRLTAGQYLTHDRIASNYGNDTLRITTRQDFQLHGVIKGDLRDTIRQLNGALVTTFGACGDVVRNVMVCPAPTADSQRRAVQDFALRLSAATLPRTQAYHQIWLDGEELIAEEAADDPLYGRTYLPRKFKIGIALPGDNCVDIFTNDVGLVAAFDGDGLLAGFNVLAGGGMGLTHNNDQTFARLADVIGFVEPEQVIDTVTAVVGIHRDYGDRTNRKHARLKYILQEWGAARFRQELQSRLSFRVQEARPMPAFQVHDHLGWHEQDNGRWYLGLPVENGRIVDRGKYRLRSGLRAIIEEFDLAIRLTPQQNILLIDIAADNRDRIEALLAEHHILTVEDMSGVRRGGLACPAMPTCGLAIAEAERALPNVLNQIEAILSDVGIPDEPISIRMTGCPNGCARPYVAEIAFVGRSLDKYTVFLGGNPIGTRLAEPFLDLIHLNDLASTLRPVLSLFREERMPEEAFGDFCQRFGLETLRRVVQEALPQSQGGDD